MVQIATLFVASLGLLSGVANALPRPDSSINEPAVSSPDGTPITDSSMPQVTSSSDSSMSSDMSSGSSMSSDMSSGSSSGSSNYGSSSGSDSSSSWGSGSASSSYGSGSGSSSYGSGSSYGSSGNSWNSASDSSMTSVAVTSTSTAWTSYSTPSYGSGSSNWDSSGYSNCVSQCMASYGSPPSMYTPPSTTTSSSSDSSSSSGSGATHTVIVAPTQGVLRYVPFALNASVGDTIQFMWGANNHTVTKSSELTPCNKTSDAAFSSGEQNLGFMFTQVVNDTNPLFFYCGTPTHCQKGMFGIINPPNAAGAATSVSSMMPSIAANSSDVMGYSAIVAKATTGNALAATWGSNIDMGSLPAWSHEFVAENVLYTRSFLAANSDVLQNDGSVNLGAAGSNPLMIPQDLSAALSNASPASSTASSASTTPAAAAAAANSPSSTAATTSTTPVNSGALSVASSKVVVGLVAAFATFMML